MPKLLATILIAGFFIAFLAGPANAHTGHKKAPAIEEPSAEDSIYAVEEDESEATTEGIDLPGSSLSRTDIFSEEIPLTSEMMDHKEHDPASAGHGEHKMPEIELAEHEWVSPKQKGYGVAAGITILSGLVFGFLTFKRPNE